MTGTNTVKATKASRATRAFEKTLAAGSGEKNFLRLYVAGATARSRQALGRVNQWCEAELKGNYRLEVIDVYQQPGRARDHQIVATPTLVKVFPRPERRFIGSLLNIADLFGDANPAGKGKIAL